MKGQSFPHCLCVLVSFGGFISIRKFQNAISIHACIGCVDRIYRACPHDRCPDIHNLLKTGYKLQGPQSSMSASFIGQLDIDFTLSDTETCDHEITDSQKKNELRVKASLYCELSFSLISNTQICQLKDILEAGDPLFETKYKRH